MDTQNQKEQRAILGGGCITLAIALIILLIAMCGCKTTETIREVPVITEHTTVQHHTDIIRDTLLQKDSVYHYVMGDTVIIEKWHHTVNVNKVLVTDTIRDTIPKVVTVTQTEIKEVNRLHWWQNALMWAGGIMLVIGVFRIKKFRF